MSKLAVEAPIGYEERAQLCHNKVARDLFTLMERKKTNLAFNANVQSSTKLLQLAKEVGPHICILKTNISLLQDFKPSVTKQLKDLAKQLHFILFEDSLADWASITNAHASKSQPSSIEALREAAQPQGNALLLSADAPSAKAALRIARSYPDFVMGFVSQKRLVDDPGLLHITPDVKAPDKAIFDQGNDIVIVGKEISDASKPAATAQMYRMAAWKAYERRFED
ncbi:MAG: orotidine-5'-phosphate decarboxylase [Nitrosomonas sp.]|nr:MAG: orotidine-5'-phosphate decarboxylase [Nitrosomonas sp.]